ncbi:MAG: SlyX protein [Alphaproteobacteria bacterium]|nr:SlyX protein [Alphaproteobacteria bacterium]
MTTDRLDRLEAHIAEQQRVIDDLSEALALQQKDIERLRARLMQSDDRIAELEAGLAPASGEKPPHY